MAKTAYEILGISENAKEREVKKAFHTLLKVEHTDQVTGNKDQATELILAYNEVMEKINRENKNNMPVEILIEKETENYKTYSNYENLKGTIEQIKSQYKKSIEVNHDKLESFISAMHERIEELFKEYDNSRQEISIDELIEKETLIYELEDDYENVKDALEQIKNQYRSNIEANPDKLKLFISAMHERIEELFKEYRNSKPRIDVDELMEKETLIYELEDGYENIKDALEQIKNQYKRNIEANPEKKDSFISAMRERIENLFLEYHRRKDICDELLAMEIEMEDRELLEGIRDNVMYYDEIFNELYEKYIVNTNTMQEETPVGPVL